MPPVRLCPDPHFPASQLACENEYDPVPFLFFPMVSPQEKYFYMTVQSNLLIRTLKDIYQIARTGCPTRVTVDAYPTVKDEEFMYIAEDEGENVVVQQ